MAYRRTENVVRKLAARHEAIVAAARSVAAESGLAAVQIAPVAARAGVAAGTVYRYFPDKSGLVGALIASACEREIDAVRRAAGAAPGPLSALVAAFSTFAVRAVHSRRLSWGVFVEPVEPDIETLRQEYRRSLAAEFEALIRAASDGGHLPEQDAALSAAALVGVLLEGLAGPLAPTVDGDAARLRATVQALALFALRGLGVIDARARGLVVQAEVPAAAAG